MTTDAKSLLNRGLSLISREMDRMGADDPHAPPLTSEQVGDLCSYMNVLKTLVGKDIGGDGNTTEYTEEELREHARAFLEGSDDKGGATNPGGAGKAKRGRKAR